MPLGEVQSVVAGVVLACLIVAAGWALFRGLAMARRAGGDTLRARQLGSRLHVAPAQSMLVYPDGRVEATPQAVQWLGLTRPPQTLADLAGVDHGIEPESASALLREIAAAQRAAKPFRLSVRARGAARTLVAVGQRAPEAMDAPGGVLVWFFDASEFEGEIGGLRGEITEYREAFEALTGLIEAAPMPMWYRDDALRLAMVNTAYVDAVDAANARDVLTRQLELVEGEGKGGPLAGAAAARTTGMPQAGALPATIGGARRLLSIHDVPLADGGVAGFAIDVHELDEARAALKRFRETQRAMLDRLSAGVAQFAADRTLDFCNLPFRRLFAMRGEWVADRPEFDRVLERMREGKRLPEVRDFPNWKAERRAWFNAPEAVEEQWHLPGGVHLRLVAQPLPEGGLLLVFEDRTEQVQLASARDTLLRVRTATFDNLFEALGVFSADGRLQIWNSKFRQIWHLEESFLSSHPRVDALAEMVAGRLANPTRAALIPELIRFATVQRQQRGGRFAMADGRHFEFGAVPLPDGNALFTMLDISDSRRIEQALRDRNEALEAGDRTKTTFLAAMSYELRTPLTSIRGFAEMLEGGFGGALSAEGGEYTRAILESSDRLAALIDDVLDLTAHETGPIERAPVDVAEVAHHAASAAKETAAAKRIDLAVEVQRSAGSVTGDARRLEQAVGHLLGHAIAVTREDGRVLLHVDGDRSGARIVVSDNGPGMDPEEAARALERFSAGGAMRRGERALGMGLPLAKRIAEAHGGTIALVSERGAGTLVTITLPRG